MPGHHQQHHHPQHDLHQNLTEVWAVGRQPGQHCVRPGLFYRAAAAAGKYHTRTRCQHTNIKQQQQKNPLLSLLFFIYQQHLVTLKPALSVQPLCLEKEKTAERCAEGLRVPLEYSAPSESRVKLIMLQKRTVIK